MPKNQDEYIPLYKEEENLDQNDNGRKGLERIFEITPENYDDVKLN